MSFFYVLENTLPRNPVRYAVVPVKRHNLCFFPSCGLHHSEIHGEVFNEPSRRGLSGTSDSLH